MGKKNKKDRLPCERDMDDLRASGLKDKTILRNKLRTGNNALIFPYRDSKGVVNCFARTKPHTPRVINGKEVKYEQPKGEGNRLYFPDESISTLQKKREPLYFTEGEKKVLSLAQEELCAVGLPGIYGWNEPGTKKLSKNFKQFKVKHRTIYLVFDYDEKSSTRRNVDLAGRHFAAALRAAGAREVLQIKLPPGNDGGKQGVDDFIVANGIEAFKALVKGAESVPEVDNTSIAKAENRTDASNAKRIVAAYGDDIRYVVPSGNFLVWDEKRFARDSGHLIESKAKAVAEQLWKDVAKEIRGGVQDKPTINAMTAHAKHSNSINGVRASVSLVRSEPGIVVDTSDCDKDPLIFNVNNGTVVLSEGSIRKHRREDLITQIAPVTFDPRAKCPTWLNFLDTIFAGDDEINGFVQRYLGYCLTGSTQEHALPILYGKGSNGKSTLCETLLSIIGKDYGMKSTKGLVMLKRGESHPTELADLLGKRVAVCMETGADRRLDEVLVKELRQLGACATSSPVMLLEVMVPVLMSVA